LQCPQETNTLRNSKKFGYAPEFMTMTERPAAQQFTERFTGEADGNDKSASVRRSVQA
jgi:hypothetical protein